MSRLLISLLGASLCLVQFAYGANNNCKTLQKELSKETLICFTDYIKAVTTKVGNKSCATVEEFVQKLNESFVLSAPCHRAEAQPARAASFAFRADLARRLHVHLLAFVKSNGTRCINDNKKEIDSCRSKVLAHIPHSKKKNKNVIARTTISHTYNKGASEDSERIHKCTITVLQKAKCPEAVAFNEGVHEIIRQLTAQNQSNDDKPKNNNEQATGVPRVLITVGYLVAAGVLLTIVLVIAVKVFTACSKGPDLFSVAYKPK